MEIILASASIRRKEILEKINLKFKIYPSNFNEGTVPFIDNNPQKYCVDLAIKKALTISNKFPNQYVIGADTIVFTKLFSP